MKQPILFSLLLFFSFSYGQQNKDVLRGDAFFKIGQYNNAIRYYERGTRKQNHSYVYFQISKCYGKLNKPELSISYLKKIKLQTPLTEEQQVDLANGLKKIGKYYEARSEFSLLKKKYPNNEKYRALYSSCDSAKVWLAQINRGTAFENFKEVNSSFSEISPWCQKDEFFFASNREDFIIKNKPGGSELPFYDLYKLPINDSIKNGKVKPFSSQVNSTTHESSIAFNSSGNKVYFTQHVSDSGGTYSRLKIFYLEKHKDRWQNPHTFVFNDSTSSFAHPFITPDENMFFFVSDMKDGMGGSDIYFCMLKDSLWSAPINMGPPINTPGNEIFPFYDAENKTLYFASDYHPGLGGYDIFEAVEDGESFKIHNMKPPINSSYDDFGIVWISKYRQLGYLVSNRPGGKGLEDIYKIFRK